MVDWQKVATSLCKLANNSTVELNDGQRASLKAVADRLPHNGVIIADEVGMGKTRIATTVTKAVIEAGGRVAILVPPGLGFQWGDELRKSHVEGAPEILRSLEAYLNAWAGSEDEHHPWANYSALIISHAFCNWQVKSNTRNNSKWSLLPQTMALMQARLRESKRMPRGARNLQRNYEQRIVAAAEWITTHASSEILESLAGQDGFNQWGNRSPFFNPANYRKNGGATKFREALERVVGLGLGEFDLVVIDEAHKSRGVESNLERLLTHVIVSSNNAKRLAMTATPIELNVSQWQQILKRIGAEDAKANNAIDAYAKAVQQVLQLPNEEQARNAFTDAAKNFQRELGQYLLRRDKREVQSVQDFATHSGNTPSDYRCLRDITVQTEELSCAWKQAVCAAEALSFVTRGTDDQAAKRLRLTLGNGHGISSLLDKLLRDEKEDPDDHDAQADADETSKPDKRLQRVEWWNGVISRALQRESGQQAVEAALYKHPTILAAVEAIETVCKQGEKVLVFGRFTRPMQALVHLLNARELLRCFDAKKHWPQESVGPGEQPAVEAQLSKRAKGESLTQLNEWLGKQYSELENQRERFRTRLRHSLHQELNGLDEALRERALIALTRPIREMLAADQPIDCDILGAFQNLITAASDQDKETVTNDDDADGNTANRFSKEILQRIEEEYGRNEGGFARLMNGNTKQPTRRLLQLAFNREHGHPKVLVAQSVVGREGLNLHEACRTVILLHAEWNPGIVEQQIGRVDRINSLWEKKLKATLSNTPVDALPKIEIRPVIFQGTYDEHHWTVLKNRWNDLRAQLHGVVITPSEAETLPPEVVDKINSKAPNFSPTQANQENA